MIDDFDEIAFAVNVEGTEPKEDPMGYDSSDEERER